MTAGLANAMGGCYDSMQPYSFSFRVIDKAAFYDAIQE